MMKLSHLALLLNAVLTGSILGQASSLITLDFTDPETGVRALGNSVTSQDWDTVDFSERPPNGSNFVEFTGGVFGTSDFGEITPTFTQSGNAAEKPVTQDGRTFLQDWVVGIVPVTRSGGEALGLGSWVGDNNGDGNANDPNGNEISWWGGSTKNVAISFDKRVIVTSAKLEGWDGGPNSPLTWEANVNGETVSPDPALENSNFDFTTSSLTQSTADGITGVFLEVGDTIEFASAAPRDENGDIILDGNGDNGNLQRISFYLVTEEGVPVLVEEVPEFAITSLEVDDNDPRSFTLNFTPDEDVTSYAVEVSETLADWEEIASDVENNGGAWTASVTLDSDDFPTVPGRLFFRLLTAPDSP